MKTFVALFAFVALASAAPNDHYHTYDSPPYLVVPQASTEFEQRLYPAGLRWACTNAAVTNSAMFDILASYIFGGNDAGASIPMTSPVKTRVDETGKTMCFYLSPEYQENPPTPNDERVFFETSDKMIVFTRDFSDTYPMPAGWAQENEDLGALVSAAGFSYDESYYYECSYDAPMNREHRRNEVWLVQA